MRKCLLKFRELKLAVALVSCLMAAGYVVVSNFTLSTTTKVSFRKESLFATAVVANRIEKPLLDQRKNVSNYTQYCTDSALRGTMIRFR